MFELLQQFLKTLKSDLDVDYIETILNEIECFPAGGNIYDTNFSKLPNETQEIVFQYMRKKAELQLKEVFKTLKFDLNDPNLSDTDSIGTPARFIKVITGNSLECDDELMCGRYARAPKLAKFPNNGERFPITKRVDITSVCSHHLLPYGTLLNENSFAIISYIPNEYVLGISKLQRYVDWVSRRPTIQEDLTKLLHNTIKDITESDSVYVGLFNLTHTCERLRGSKSSEGVFTTEYYTGKFNDLNVRNSIIQGVR